jgi:hypothetical protein
VALPGCECAIISSARCSSTTPDWPERVNMCHACSTISLRMNATISLTAPAALLLLVETRALKTPVDSTHPVTAERRYRERAFLGLLPPAARRCAHYRFQPSPAAAAAGCCRRPPSPLLTVGHRYRICAGNSFTPSILYSLASTNPGAAERLGRHSLTQGCTCGH